VADDLIPSAPDAPAPPDPVAPADSSDPIGELTAEVDADAESQPLPTSPSRPDGRVRDNMATPPTDRYPGARPSPREPIEAEVWHARPDPPAPGPTLRQRLWWVLPFGTSFLTGLVFVLACALIDDSGHPDFLGRACFAATFVALAVAGLFVSTGMSGRDWYASSNLPSYPVIAACVGFFALPPTATWILLGLR
jgi:hypothetical protein